ncbi:hypothetical protein scyTo_0006707 [Scyliorhinus torazame]|uniref:Uncharacterized protein n=1 Tax=Scyliorhinus torazame TaxID=75743 RepID=A0A401PJI4_SCYTO|nr:hypothetical protein [Scyliorhinus torazame]
MTIVRTHLRGKRPNVRLKHWRRSYVDIRLLVGPVRTCLISSMGTRTQIELACGSPLRCIQEMLDPILEDLDQNRPPLELMPPSQSLPLVLGAPAMEQLISDVENAEMPDEDPLSSHFEVDMDILPPPEPMASISLATPAPTTPAGSTGKRLSPVWYTPPDATCSALDGRAWLGSLRHH